MIFVKFSLLLTLLLGLGEWKVEPCLNQSLYYRAIWGKFINPLFTTISPLPGQPWNLCPCGAEVSWLLWQGALVELGRYARTILKRFQPGSKLKFRGTWESQVRVFSVILLTHPIHFLHRFEEIGWVQAHFFFFVVDMFENKSKTNFLKIFISLKWFLNQFF